MLQWLLGLLWDRTDHALICRAALGALTKQFGGSVVLTIAELDAALDRLPQMEVRKNDHPEGVRIFFRDCA